MKQCKNCGKAVNDEVKFCPNCGSTEFVKGQQADKAESTLPPAKKNTPWIPIVIIVLVIAIAAVAIVLLTNKKDDDSGKKEDTSISETADANAKADGKTTSTTTTSAAPTAPQKVAYTKGTLTGRTYTNEWLNFKLDIPFSWKMSDAEEIAELEDDKTDCGFMAEGYGEDVRLLAFAFEDIEFQTDTAYLEDLVNNFIPENTENTNYKVNKSEISSIKLGGETYMTQDVSVAGTDTMYIKVAVLYKDNRAVALAATANSLNDVNEVFNSVQTVY